MQLTFDIFEQLEDLYEVKSRHLGYLNATLPEGWQTTVPGGYGGMWRNSGDRFLLKSYDPFPKPLQLLLPDRRNLVSWTMIGFANEMIMAVSPESLGDFLALYVDNPTARRNLSELFLGEDMTGPGMKAFGSLVVCAREENRFIDLYLPMLRAFSEGDPRRVATDSELRDTALGFLREIDDFHRYLDSDIYFHKRFSKDLKMLFRGTRFKIVPVAAPDGGEEQAEA